MKRYEAIEAVVSPIVQHLGHEFVGLEYLPQGKHSVLRVYIDTEKVDGIGVEDCAVVSRQVSAVLEVEAILSEAYTLEVSSPGLDRLLFTREQMIAHIGRELTITLGVPLEGQRHFTGILIEVDAKHVKVNVNEQTVLLLLSHIDKARLVPIWEGKTG
jgi:ribosome maturation factor RimP